MNISFSLGRLLGAVAVVFLVVVFFMGIRHDLANPTPVKPEFDVVIVETNVPAMTSTLTKTDNGRKITWGFATVNGKTLMLFPIIE